MVMYAGRVAEEGPVAEVFRVRATRTPRSCSPPSRTSTPTGARSRSSRARRRTCATRRPGCRFAPRCSFVMDVCTEVVPPETTFDGVRVACHLYPVGGAGGADRGVAPTMPSVAAAAVAPVADGAPAPTPSEARS